MRKIGLYFLSSFAILVGFADIYLLGLILIWLIVYRGYVTCGKAILDNPTFLDWAIPVFFLVGIPLLVLIADLMLIRFCLRNLFIPYKQIDGHAAI
jgi:hypothetical protein